MKWNEYQIYRQEIRNLDDSTKDAEGHLFWAFIARYFVDTHASKNLKNWHRYIPDLTPWLLKELKEKQYAKRVLWALERFGKWLYVRRHIEQPWVIELPTEGRQRLTPLKTSLTPDNLLAWAQSHLTQPTTLPALLAYFASLQPGEMYALTKEDFVTGPNAVTKTRTYAGFQKHKLGSRLSVRIEKIRPANKQTKSLPKNDYRYGFVNIWYPEAAKLIARLVKNCPKGLLFKHSRPHLDRLWKLGVQKDLRVSAYDMRRSSCLYLARTVRVEPTLLQDHMRHADLQTTQLYMRNPGEDLEIDVELVDFDDVV